MTQNTDAHIEHHASARNTDANHVDTPDDTPTDDILLDVREVAGYTIRKLSFGKLAVITPMIAGISDKVKYASPNGLNNLSATDIVMILMTLMPDLIPVMAKVVDADIEDIAALDADDGLNLAFNIWNMNSRLFTSFFMIGSSLSAKSR